MFCFYFILFYFSMTFSLNQCWTVVVGSTQHLHLHKIEDAIKIQHWKTEVMSVSLCEHASAFVCSVKITKRIVWTKKCHLPFCAWYDMSIFQRLFSEKTSVYVHIVHHHISLRVRQASFEASRAAWNRRAECSQTVGTMGSRRVAGNALRLY